MNISAKRAALPSMSSARRLHYEGVIYRFKFLMIDRYTAVCVFNCYWIYSWSGTYVRV